MAKQQTDDHRPQRGRRDLEELAREQGIRPIASLEDLERFVLDVWDSDEDLDAFLADVRASRDADVG